MEIGLIKETKNNEGLYCILISLFLGVVFDWFFFDRAFGISYFIFIALCVSFFLWSIRDRLRFTRSFGWLLLVQIALLSLSLAINTNEVFHGLNMLVVPVLMIASSTIIYNPNTKWDETTFIVELLSKGIANVFVNLGKPFGIVATKIKSYGVGELKESKKQILLGILISLPLLAVIIVLLSSADMVFGYYLTNLTEIFGNINIDKFVPHVVIILLVSFYLFGYVWGFKRKLKTEDLDESMTNKSGVIDFSLEPITVITVLVALNIVYLLFTFIQFSYLYGGGTMTLPANFTYAEYARRGFFELSAVTFINFIIVLNCIKFIKKENTKLLAAANILFSVLIFFTLNMLFSANFKLTLYENTFGFTYLRVVVHLFMLLLFILCLIVATGIWVKKVPIIKSIIVACIVMYTIVNYLNINGFIAWKNVERYYETGKIDVVYLTSLSYEAVPYMLELRTSKDNFIRDTINNNLRQRLDRLQKEQHWSEFNFSKNKIRNLLKNEAIK